MFGHSQPRFGADTTEENAAGSETHPLRPKFTSAWKPGEQNAELFGGKPETIIDGGGSLNQETLLARNTKSKFTFANATSTNTIDPVPPTPKSSGLFQRPPPPQGSTNTNMFGKPLSECTLPLGNATNPANDTIIGEVPANVKFTAPTGTDTLIKENGATHRIETRYQCISAMNKYKTFSFEEIRLKDPMACRRGFAPGAKGTKPFDIAVNSSKGKSASVITTSKVSNDREVPTSVKVHAPIVVDNNNNNIVKPDHSRKVRTQCKTTMQCKCKLQCAFGRMESVGALGAMEGQYKEVSFEEIRLRNSLAGCPESVTGTKGLVETPATSKSDTMCCDAVTSTSTVTSVTESTTKAIDATYKLVPPGGGATYPSAPISTYTAVKQNAALNRINARLQCISASGNSFEELHVKNNEARRVGEADNGPGSTVFGSSVSPYEHVYVLTPTTVAENTPIATTHQETLANATTTGPRNQSPASETEKQDPSDIGYAQALMQKINFVYDGVKNSLAARLGPIDSPVVPEMDPSSLDVSINTETDKLDALSSGAEKQEETSSVYSSTTIVQTMNISIVGTISAPGSCSPISGTVKTFVSSSNGACPRQKPLVSNTTTQPYIGASSSQKLDTSPDGITLGTSTGSLTYSSPGTKKTAVSSSNTNQEKPQDSSTTVHPVHSALTTQKIDGCHVNFWNTNNKDRDGTSSHMTQTTAAISSSVVANQQKPVVSSITSPIFVFGAPSVPKQETSIFGTTSGTSATSSPSTTKTGVSSPSKTFPEQNPVSSTTTHVGGLSAQNTDTSPVGITSGTSLGTGTYSGAVTAPVPSSGPVNQQEPLASISNTTTHTSATPIQKMDPKKDEKEKTPKKLTSSTNWLPAVIDKLDNGTLAKRLVAKLTTKELQSHINYAILYVLSPWIFPDVTTRCCCTNNHQLHKFYMVEFLQSITGLGSKSIAFDKLCGAVENEITWRSTSSKESVNKFSSINLCRVINRVCERLLHVAEKMKKWIGEQNKALIHIFM